MIGRDLTIFISSKKGSLKELHISKSRLRYGCVGLIVLALFFCTFAADYFFSFSNRLNYQKYQVENKDLKSQLSHLHLKMERLNSRLHQIEDFSHKIKLIAGLEEHTHSALAMGPLSDPTFPDVSSTFDAKLKGDRTHSRKPSSVPSVSDSKNLPNTSMDSIVVYMDRLDKKSKLVHQDITLMMEKLYEKRDIISSTPSILPAKGWISSRFGYRQYPFTGEVSLHEGMDIAGFPGTPVYAPSDGVVMFAGYKQGYGKVIVLDHGYEMSTLYAHLKDIMVSKKQKVERKQVIGTIGNTGHSTGPHLHYEVRISNVPVDPSEFILDSL